MYGWINNCLEDMIITKFGLEKWEKIKDAANCFIPTGDFILSVHYDDELTYSLIEAAARVLNFKSGNEVWEIYGRHFIHFLEANHYYGTLRGQGNTLRDWIQNINEPHRLLRARYPNCTLPEFWSENDKTDPSGESILLHYYSPRKDGLGSIVVGMCKEASKVYFEKDLEMELVSTENLVGSGNDTKGSFAHHSIWKLKNVGKEVTNTFLSSNNSLVPSSGSLLLTNSENNVHIHALTNSSIITETNDVSIAELAASAGCPFHKQNSASVSIRALEVKSSSIDNGGCESFSKYSVSVNNGTPLELTTKSTSSDLVFTHISPYSTGYLMGPRCFKRIFPFHIIVNQKMEIVQLGNKLNEFLERNGHPTLLGMQISEVFSLTVTNTYPWSWSGLRKLQSTSIITLHSVHPEKLKLNLVGEVTILDDDIKYERKVKQRVQTCGGQHDVRFHKCPDDDLGELNFELDGDDDDDHEDLDDPSIVAALLVNPVVSDLVALMNMGFINSDLPRHSFQRDLLQIEEHLKTELDNTVRMTELSKRLETESKKSIEALKTKRIFVRYVSHEIRTPLNVALLGLKYLEDEVLLIDNIFSGKKIVAPDSSNLASNGTESLIVKDLHQKKYDEELSESISIPSNDAKNIELEQIVFSDQTGFPSNDRLSILDSDVDEKMSLKDRLYLNNNLVRDVVADVKASCILAVEILNDLLLYEKIDDGIFSLTKSPMSVRQFIGEAEKLFKMQAKGAGVKFVITGNIFNPLPTQCSVDSVSNTDKTYDNRTQNEDGASTSNSFVQCHRGNAVFSSFDELCEDEKYVDAVSVDCDKAKLHQVLRNLFTNAIKFTPQNGLIVLSCDVIDSPSHYPPYSAIPNSFYDNFAADCDSQPTDGVEACRVIQEIHSIPENSFTFEGTLPTYGDQNSNTLNPNQYVPFLRITVTDSGCGISREDQTHLFHEFIQVKADKLQNGQGSGLGLWIAANILKMHGGRIGVVSRGEGFGTTFAMDLPCHVVSSRDSTYLEISKSHSGPSIDIGIDASLGDPTKRDTLPGDNSHPLYRTLARQMSRLTSLHNSNRRSDNSIAMEQLLAISPATPHRSISHSSSGSGSRKSDSFMDSILSNRRGFLPRYNSVTPRGAVEEHTPDLPAVITGEHQHKDSLNSKSVPSCSNDASAFSMISALTLPSRNSESSLLMTPLTQSPSKLLPSQASMPPKLVKDKSDTAQEYIGAHAYLNIRSLQDARILIVDDAPSNRKMVKRILSSKFQQLAEAENGQQAVDLAMQAYANGNPFHVIMMDFMMPIMNGLEATVLIKQRVPFPTLVMGVTGILCAVTIFFSVCISYVLN